MRNEGVGGPSLNDFSVFQLKVFRGTVWEMKEFAQVIADKRLNDISLNEHVNSAAPEGKIKEAVFEQFTSDFPMTFKPYMVEGGSPQLLIYTMHTANGKGSDLGLSTRLGLNLLELEPILVFPRDELIASLVQEPRKPQIYLAVDNTKE